MLEVTIGNKATSGDQKSCYKKNYQILQHFFLGFLPLWLYNFVLMNYNLLTFIMLLSFLLLLSIRDSTKCGIFLSLTISFMPGLYTHRKNKDKVVHKNVSQGLKSDLKFFYISLKNSVTP